MTTPGHSFYMLESGCMSSDTSPKFATPWSSETLLDTAWTCMPWAWLFVMQLSSESIKHMAGLLCCKYCFHEALACRIGIGQISLTAGQREQRPRIRNTGNSSSFWVISPTARSSQEIFECIGNIISPIRHINNSMEKIYHLMETSARICSMKDRKSGMVAAAVPSFRDFAIETEVKSFD